MESIVSEARVSSRKVEKQVFPKPKALRSTPPSKKEPLGASQGPVVQGVLSPLAVYGQPKPPPPGHEPVRSTGFTMPKPLFAVAGNRHRVPKLSRVPPRLLQRVAAPLVGEPTHS